MNDPEHSNRLAQEKSPYLLQHAHNPVNWFPWGVEAFEEAKRQDKPIFLSIGYATCHWCHVMERESFTSPEIAEMMNETFINIKVDREEHPEVDNLYMEFAQALMSSAGGWPLNLVLTPDLKPFFAVTYLPPETRRGLIGFDQFIKQIHMLWLSEERSGLIEQADKIVEVFAKATTPEQGELPTEDFLDHAVEVLFDIADPVYGGIKGEPKFPLGYQASFLLQYAKAKSDSRALFYVELTLDMMARGGIHDHLGGGFSRYCIDEKWCIPHFEKMLYDNAILASTYLQVYQYTKKEPFAAMVRSTLSYALREMKGEEGGFFSAQDADSEGQEGKYYTWTFNEIEEILGPDDMPIFSAFYGISPEGNFEGTNILHAPMPSAEFAETAGISVEMLEKDLSEMRTNLLERRLKREPPFKDDKVITSWNGLMIDVLIRAGHTLKDDSFKQAALKAAQFIRNNLYEKDRLKRRFRDGDARFPAGLDDYAFLIRALITLFEHGEGDEWLKWAIQLCDTLEIHFRAPEGAYYQTEENPYLLLRKCEFYDGAEPSGNAVQTENFLRLYQITQDERFLERAERIMQAARGFIEAFPPGACYHFLALQRYLDRKAPTLVIALNENESLKEEIHEAISKEFIPHAAVIWKKGNTLDTLLPTHCNQLPIDGKTTLYLCQGEVCSEPLVEKEAMIHAIGKL
ncbi:MAG: hypothetical protein K940chlam2_00818 [Chlamydiae bacterium]|nr:hypothetical protein [Chlamydiota bacterium]